MKCTALERPLSIDCIQNGEAYELSKIPFVQTNLFLKVGRVNDLFVKVPSERGFEDYRNFIKLGGSSPQDIRSIEEAEKFARLELTIEQFPELKQVFAKNAEFAHYLVVHSLQYHRLENQSAIGIPRARFGVLRSTRLGILRRFQPALFQERVRGTTLWSMYDFETLRVRSKWQRFLPAISVQLSKLASSECTNHIDWNIKNFVFAETEERLFYVDLKPTTFVAKHSNQQNLKGILDYFVR